MNESGGDWALRFTALLGLAVLIALAWAISLDRKRMPWRTVVSALALQFGFAVLVFKTPIGGELFVGANAAVNQLIAFTHKGSEFIFGSLMPKENIPFVLNALPAVIFVGALVSVLYHLRLAPFVVHLAARGLSKLLGTSGAESVAAFGNVFLGQTEAPLLVRPYIAQMTRSELFTLMVTGLATIAGALLVVFAGELAQAAGAGEGGKAMYAGHLVTASLLSAPAAIAFAKVIVPETETPLTLNRAIAPEQSRAANVIDAAAEGALSALRLAVNIAALLLAFVALVALADAAFALVGGWFGAPDLSLARIFGWMFAPFAFLMGIPWGEAQQVGSLLGTKTVLNEYIAYIQLTEEIKAGALTQRTVVITSYALCGFANFSSLAILLGGIGGIAPQRRPEIARLGLRALAAGTFATLMTGCIVAVLY